MAGPQAWTYESWDERKQRELSEFDAIVQGGRDSFASPDPLAPTGNAQSVAKWGARVSGTKPAPAAEQPQGGGSSTLGAIGRVLSEIDRPLSERFGIEIPALPGPFDEIGNFVLREGTRPTNLAMAALGGPVALTALRTAGRLGKAAAWVAEPVLKGGFASRLAGEAAVNAGGRIAGDAAVEALPDDAPDSLKAIASIMAGVAGGVGAAKGVGLARGVYAAGERAAVQQAAAIPENSALARYRATTDEALPEVEKFLDFGRLRNEADAPNFMARWGYEMLGEKADWLRPGLSMQKNIIESNIGADSAKQAHAQIAFGTRQPILDSIDAAFGPGATLGGRLDIPFAGSPEAAAYGGTSTLKDIFENPNMYPSLTPQQKAMIPGYHQRNEVERASAQQVGVDIKEFTPGGGGAYLPNKDVSESVDQWLQNMEGTTAASRLSPTTARQRDYATGYDRWLHDMQLVAENKLTLDQVFVPETNIRVLTEMLDTQKANAVGSAVFKAGIGGKTISQVAEELAPELKARRESLVKQIAAVRGKQVRARISIASDSRLASRFEDAAGTMDNRSATLLGQIETATGDPVIDRIVGGIDELDANAARFQQVAATVDGRADLRAIGLEHLQAEMGPLKDELKDLRKSYGSAGERVNPRDYVRVDEVGGKYFPSEDAGQIKRLLSREVSSVAKWIGEFNATVLGGDLSPIVGQQGQVQWLTAPIQTTKMVVGALKNGWDQGDLLRAFRPEEWAAKVNADPQGAADFARATGRTIAGSTPDEFAGGWFRALPGGVGAKFAKFNDAIFSATLHGQRQLLDDTVSDLVRGGMPREQALAEAGQFVMQFIPTPNAAGAGLSAGQAAMLRAPVTSLTFIQRPIQTITDAGEAIAKGATGNFDSITPRQKLAFKATLRMAGVASGLAASSAAIEALRTGGDPLIAARDAINPDPKNSKFLTLTFPGGVSVPLGGPYRALIRAIAPGEVKLAGHDEKVILPFAGAVSYFKNRVTPPLKAVFDVASNEDFYGNKIMSGDFPGNLLGLAAYGATAALPITAQSPIQSLRRGEGVGTAALSGVGGFLGTNVSPRSPAAALDDIARQRYGTSFYDAEPAQQAAIKADHADIWSEAIRRGSQERQISEVQRAEYRSQQVADDKLLLSGQVTREDWKKERDRRRIELRARLSQVYGDDPVTPAAAAKDPMLHFISAIQQGTDPATKRVDWEFVDEQRSGFTDEENAFIDRNTGASDTPVSKLYRELSTEYYAIPQYTGYDADESRDINTVWQIVRNTAVQIAGGQKPTPAVMAIAYRKAIPSGSIDPKVAQGVQRRILGTLTESKKREQFRKRTPATALIAGQGPLTEKDIAAIELALP